MCTRKKNRNCITVTQMGREFCFFLSGGGGGGAINLFRREDVDVSRDGETDR